MRQPAGFTPAGFSLVFAVGGDLLLMLQFSFQHSSARLTLHVE